MWYNGERCAWAGAGPQSVRHPSCQQELQPVPWIQTKPVEPSPSSTSTSTTTPAAILLPSSTSSPSASPAATPSGTAVAGGASAGKVHVTRDAGLNNLAALLNAAPLHLLPDRITTEAAYSAIMGCVRSAATDLLQATSMRVRRRSPHSDWLR